MESSRSQDLDQDAPATADVYARHVLEQAPRLLSMLDREPDSATYGSFDRDHWGWKFRDFPLGMLQSGVYALALLWKHDLPGSPYHRNDAVLSWIVAALEQTISRQHPNGSFDAFTPNEQDGGSTLGVAHTVAETLLVLGDAAPLDLLARCKTVLLRACRFAEEHEENHAFISNHQALFANAFMATHELTGDARARASAQRTVDRILAMQSTEGWYSEYYGADPGYESLGIYYMARYWKRTGSDAVLASLRKATDFYRWFVHPDGSVGGVYGSRHTNLYFPAGFEMLAPVDPAAAAVAGFMRSRIDGGNVVSPRSVDAENLPACLFTYLHAYLEHSELPDERPALPCEGFEGVRRFEESGLVVAGTPTYYAVVNAGRGGTCRVFDRRQEQLLFENAGYIVESEGKRWSSQIQGNGSIESNENDGALHCRASLAEVRQELPTPFRYVVLRGLNLTLFRVPALANRIRRQIVKRLILERRVGPIQLDRTLVFESDRIRVHDRLTLTDRNAHVESVRLVPRFTGIHMGSAKYFHPNELRPLPAVPVEHMAAALSTSGIAECTFEVSPERPRIDD